MRGRSKITWHSVQLFIVYCMLSIMGYFNLYSAVLNSRYTRLPNSQIIWIAAGIIMIFFTVFVLEKIKIGKFIFPLLLIMIAALSMLLIFGETWGDSKRWFSTPFGGLQPSEFAKPALVVVLSFLYANSGNFRKMNLINFIITVIVAGLVAIEPDLGTSLVYLFVYFVFFLFTEPKKRVIFVFILTVILLIVVVFYFGLKDYQRERITAFLNPSTNPDGYYQTKQSLTMIASGGLTGKGYQRGPGNLYGYIPADHTDFVLAVFAEENGFYGMLVFYGLWFVFFINCILLFLKRSSFKKWMILGIFSIFFIQFTINIGMVLGLLPVTGLPLPFFTYGGSSTISNSISTGILIWCSMKEFTYDRGVARVEDYKR
ncbi:MAG TPA: FtsW/RodA/SpoVE family cell cycle protein [Thermotogota bacterium]|nr:FtsW/RodA/SpoVE family cell cycle protein [Thermotogota bacterium]